MATPYVVQSPPLGGRAGATSSQELSNYDSYGKTLRQYCRAHHDRHSDGHGGGSGSGQCHSSDCNWCAVCEYRYRDRKPCLGRRRCRSESTEREQGTYHRITHEDCDKSSRNGSRDYNLRSGSNYHERFRNKISRKDSIMDYYSGSSVNNKHSYRGYPLLDGTNTKQSSSSHTSTKGGSFRQLLGSCENHVEHLNRHAYFSKKYADSRSSEFWLRDDSTHSVFRKQDPYTEQMDVLRTKLRELKKTPSNRKKNSLDKYPDVGHFISDPKGSCDHYAQEIEMLKSRFHELKDGSQEGKRVRQLSESETGAKCKEDAGPKRSRDDSSHSKHGSLMGLVRMQLEMKEKEGRNVRCCCECGVILKGGNKSQQKMQHRETRPARGNKGKRRLQKRTSRRKGKVVEKQRIEEVTVMNERVEIIATMDQPINPAMLVPRIPAPNIPSNDDAADSVSSVSSSDSDSDCADSDDIDVDVDVNDIDDDDDDNHSVHMKVEPVKSVAKAEEERKKILSPILSAVSSNFSSNSANKSASNSPSHVVGDTLGAISLSDNPSKSSVVEKVFAIAEEIVENRALDTVSAKSSKTDMKHAGDAIAIVAEVPAQQPSTPAKPVLTVTPPPSVPALAAQSSSVMVQHPVTTTLSKAVVANTSIVAVPVKRTYVGLHPALRASLFSYVPPFINFSTYDEKAIAFPHQVENLMKWKLSKITPVVVKKIIINSGYKLVRRSNEWCGTWGKHMKSICFKTLRDFQKMNHFPGTFQIGRKDNLWRNILRFMMKYGKKEFGFMPRTYVLPQDSKSLRAAWEKHCGRERWIIKPPASARGSGIKVIYKWSQIPKKCPLVVQKYISDPYLINGSKFDLRLYAVITSVNPLRVYLYDNGLVRFASVKYSSDLSTLVDRYMHLTNYSINKLSSQYTQNDDTGACQGHKWTLKALWVYLEKEKGVDVKKLWAHMVDLVIKTMICGESAITELTEENLASRYCSYELFGVDILLDQDLKPWLLEVNISPSLHSSTPLDMAVKAPMVRDLLNLAGYQIPNKLTVAQQEHLYSTMGVKKSFCYDKRLYTTTLSQEERQKHMEYEHIDNRFEYLNNILEKLTPDDVRHLIQYEDELTQKGNFQKVFPTAYTHHYLQFFEAPRYYNMLFDAWENRYHKDRKKGISLLEDLCRKKVHLECVPSAKVSPNPTPAEEPDTEEIHQKPAGVNSGHILREHKSKEHHWTLSATALCKAARSRGSKPGVVAKPFPRSTYITRSTKSSYHEKSFKTKS